MFLTLTTDDGIVLDRWNVEEDFGDVSKDLPRAEMMRELTNAIDYALDSDDAIKRREASNNAE